MRKIGFCLASIGLVFFMWGTPARGRGKMNDNKLLQKLADENNLFALQIFGKIAETQKDRNVFFSPFSISTAMAMAYAGAKGNTANEMAQVLHFNLPQEKLHSALFSLVTQIKKEASKKSYELNIANALWGQTGFHFQEMFLKLIKKYYEGRFFEVNFRVNPESARKKINSWVEEQTRDKIRDLLRPGDVTTLTRLILTNAIYFKGNWASKFKEENTKPATFYGYESKTKVPMMKQTGEFRYMEKAEKLQVLELPYEGGNLSMIILLPSRKYGINALRKELSLKNLNLWLSEMYKRKVIVYLPKFELKTRYSLADILSEMGMPTAFSKEADFSGITGRKDIFISKVVHQAYMKVNEEGTEAAAATGVIMKVTALPTPPPVFRVDHPFVFLIMHKSSGSILFMGSVFNL